MLYTPTTKRALRFCMEAHAGQRDKAGLPYCNHPLHLAEQMSTEDETCAALLHDVMEDCGATAGDLLALGVSPAAVCAVELLTHRGGVPYLDYVRALRSDPIARRVKAADLRHNCDLTRLDHVTDKDVARLRRYLQARVALGDMATELRTPLGLVRMEVAGEPFPFEACDESRAAAAFAPLGETHPGDVPLGDVCPNDTHPGDACPTAPAPGEKDASPRPPVCRYGRADGAFLLRADVLPLAVGDRVTVRCDFGCAVCHAGEGVASRVWQGEGATVGLGFSDASDAGPTGVAPAGRSWRLDRSTDAYEVVEDPAARRYQPLGNRFCVRVAWRDGASEEDVRIVAEVAG
jgi:hypothetical protein